MTAYGWAGRTAEAAGRPRAPKAGQDAIGVIATFSFLASMGSGIVTFRTEDEQSTPA